MKHHIKPTHINDIQVGDVVETGGQLKTVSPGDIRKGGLMGTTLWGDSYRLGTVPVKLVVIETPGHQGKAP